MAYPEDTGTQRNRVAELNEGQTDGKYKKAIMDRGGFPENETARDRVTLTQRNYDLEDTPTVLMDLPGGSFEKQRPNFTGTKS